MKIRSFKSIFIVIIAVIVVAGAYFYSRHFERTMFHKDAINVFDLLEHPVYEKEIWLYGRVEDLGKLLCSCFHLVFTERVIDVWYDSMAESDDKQRPKVNAEKINNGDWILVKGELKSTEGLMPSITFWATKIVKTVN